MGMSILNRIHTLIDSIIYFYYNVDYFIYFSIKILLSILETSNIRLDLWFFVYLNCDILNRKHSIGYPLNAKGYCLVIYEYLIVIGKPNHTPITRIYLLFTSSLEPNHCFPPKNQINLQSSHQILLKSPYTALASVGVRPVQLIPPPCVWRFILCYF